MAASALKARWASMRAPPTLIGPTIGHSHSAPLSVMATTMSLKRARSRGSVRLRRTKSRSQISLEVANSALTRPIGSTGRPSGSPARTRRAFRSPASAISASLGGGAGAAGSFAASSARCLATKWALAAVLCSATRAAA